MNYCTLFDASYLIRGLTMYNSLKKVTPDFHLYVFTFDQESHSFLLKEHLENMTVIGLEDFESEELLEIKKGRSKAEYCWTCTPSVISYCLDVYELNDCTYIDADLYFFSNPIELIDEMNSYGKSVLISEHRYTPLYNQALTSGIYCVQFMTFKNNIEGRIVLNWWRERCNEWCFSRYEDGKFGDQKYLDDWPERFSCVHVLNHLGGGVAPWNVQQYSFFIENNKIIGRDKKTRETFPLIFYHFHSVKFYSNDRMDFGIYQLSSNVVQIIYSIYINNIIFFRRTMNIDHLYDFKNHCSNSMILRRLFSAARYKILGKKVNFIISISRFLKKKKNKSYSSFKIG